jgi:hypothetical protein
MMKFPTRPRESGCTANAPPVWSARAGSRGATGDAVAAMRSLVRVCAIGGALLTAGCSSWTPSWDWVPSSLSGGANVSLTIESDPPGADAKTSLGPSCRTPCMLPVPADREFTVNYSLNGYVPQVVPVRPRSVENFRSDGDVGCAPMAEVAPNPVYAQLEPAPPPAPTRKRGGRPKQPAKQPPR